MFDAEPRLFIIDDEPRLLISKKRDRAMLRL